MLFEVDEFLLEDQQRVVHHVVHLRLSLGDQSAFLLDVSAHDRKHQLRIDAVDPVDQHNAQFRGDEGSFGA